MWVVIILSVINLATIFFVIFCGFFLADISNWNNFLPFGFSSIFKGAAKAYSAFSGYDTITIMSEESVNPSKSVPFALMITTIFVAITYSTLTAFLTLMVPYTAISGNAALVSIFRFYNWEWAVYLTTAGNICAFLGLLLCSVLRFARSCYAMASDGLLVPWLRNVNKSTQIPLFSTILGAIFATLTSTFLSLGQIAELLAFAYLMCDSLLAISVVVMRYSNQKLTQTSEKLTEDATIMSMESQKLLPKHNPGWKNKQFFLFTSFVLLSIISAGFLKAFSNTENFPFLIVFVLILLFACCFLFLFWLTAEKVNKNNDSFQVPLVPLIPAASLVLNLVIISQLDWLTWLFSIIWGLIGVVVYFVYGIKHSNLEQTQPITEMTERK